MRYDVRNLSAPLVAAEPERLASISGQLSEYYRAAHRANIPPAELERRLACVRVHNGRAGLVLPIPRYVAADPFKRDPLATDDHFVTLQAALMLLDSSQCPLAEMARRRAAAQQNTMRASAREGASNGR